MASDEQVLGYPIGDRGSGVVSLWRRDDPGQFPDDGTPPATSADFPPVGGCQFSVIELAPEGDDFDGFVVRALTPWADADEPGMHRTATLDYDLVLEGVVGLELDDGVEVTLRAGDAVVMNGTRHRWHNRGDGVARMISANVGAHHQIAGGHPV